MTRRNILILVLIFSFVPVFSQVTGLLSGTVSYQSAQSVYVKFDSTVGMSIGDTLYIQEQGSLVPALVIRHTSSISVVCDKLGDQDFSVGDVVVFDSGNTPEVETVEPQPRTEVPAPEVPAVPEPQNVPEDKVSTEEPVQYHESIRGRLSASLYSSVFNAPADDIQRLRYTFSMQAGHISDSKVSAETYISFRHQLNDWNAEKVEMSRALRVYSAALKYDVSPTTLLSVGRKVNTHISNIGAIDGLQAEHTSGQVVYGGFAGTRPDHKDYGFNADLLQLGGFVALRTESAHGMMQNSLALVEQRNNGMTDRRFAYFQHSSTLTKTLSAFSSFEVDLYERPDSVSANTFRLTGAYVSLNYRPSRKISLFGSYDARKNVIYYETYRNFIDELIEQETRQGLRFRANYRPVKYLSIGSSVGYRFQKAQGSNSMNMYHYVTYSRVPWLNASMTASATILENSYLHGLVYGLRVSRDILKQKVYTQLEFRRVDYAYGTSDVSLEQSIIGANLSWRLNKKLSFSIDYEGILQSAISTHRMHFNVIRRF